MGFRSDFEGCRGIFPEAVRIVDVCVGNGTGISRRDSSTDIVRAGGANGKESGD